jgi:hypothetical protein
MFDKLTRQFRVFSSDARVKKVQHYMPAVGFLFGFVWDNLTLQRIDNPFDMTTFAAFIVLSGAAIVLMGRGVTFRFSKYLPVAVQFFFGGLFSSFVVYYVKSASSLPSLFFMVLLLAFLVGNEFVEKRLHNITLASIIYALVCFMYFNAMLPIAIHRMDGLVFCGSVLIALGADRKSVV